MGALKPSHLRPPGAPPTHPLFPRAGVGLRPAAGAGRLARLDRRLRAEADPPGGAVQQERGRQALPQAEAEPSVGRDKGEAEFERRAIETP